MHRVDTSKHKSRHRVAKHIGTVRDTGRNAGIGGHGSLRASCRLVEGAIFLFGPVLGLHSHAWVGTVSITGGGSFIRFQSVVDARGVEGGAA
jgi:hypothetical protein